MVRQWLSPRRREQSPISTDKQKSFLAGVHWRLAWGAVLVVFPELGGQLHSCFLAGLKWPEDGPIFGNHFFLCFKHHKFRFTQYKLIGSPPPLYSPKCSPVAAVPSPFLLPFFLHACRTVIYASFFAFFEFSWTSSIGSIFALLPWSTLSAYFAMFSLIQLTRWALNNMGIL